VRDAVGTEALQESGDIAGIRQREGVGVTVMGEGEAKEFVSNRMGFYMVELGQTRDKIFEVFEVMVFHPEVIED
jgi:hypothetical protein